jgi:hypothetical protein
MLLQQLGYVVQAWRIGRKCANVVPSASGQSKSYLLATLLVRADQSDRKIIDTQIFSRLGIKIRGSFATRRFIAHD